MRFDASGFYGQFRRDIIRNITAREYMKELSVKKTLCSVRKQKISFLFMQRSFTVEKYTQSKESLTVLRTQVPEKTHFQVEKEIPDFIKVIKDVTGLKEYSTLSIAQKIK